jgi:heme/copper-type cytochrome/quinol oxidase subunit 4
MSLANSSFFADSRGPPWLPASAADARKIAYWGQLMCFVFMIVFLILGVLFLIAREFGGGFGWGAYFVISGFADFIILILLKSTVFEHMDQGRFNEASDHLLVLGVLGIVLGVIPGIFLITAFARLQEVFQPQYQPYAPGTYQEGRPPEAPSVPYPPPEPVPAPQQAPAQSQPETAQPKQKHPEMVKCKKCGVQYPAFMRTCPNCGEER